MKSMLLNDEPRERGHNFASIPPIDTSNLDLNTMSSSSSTSDGKSRSMSFGGLQSQISRKISRVELSTKELRGKAVVELKEWTQKASRGLEGLKGSIKEEVKRLELEGREKQRCVQTREAKPKQLIGGWVLTRPQMSHLKENPYFYNASAGSYLELFCLQR